MSPMLRPMSQPTGFPRVLLQQRSRFRIDAEMSKYLCMPGLDQPSCHVSDAGHPRSGGDRTLRDDGGTWRGNPGGRCCRNARDGNPKGGDGSSEASFATAQSVIRLAILTPRIAASANVTLMAPLQRSMRCRLIGRARLLSKLARWEGLWAGRALHSPSRPQPRTMGQRWWRRRATPPRPTARQPSV